MTSHLLRKLGYESEGIKILQERAPIYTFIYPWHSAVF